MRAALVDLYNAISAAAGEIVWRDDRGVTCRRWNWRQGVRTRITTGTTSALFVLDVLDPMTDDEASAAAEALTAALLALSPETVVSRRLITPEDPQA